MPIDQSVVHQIVTDERIRSVSQYAFTVAGTFGDALNGAQRAVMLAAALNAQAALSSRALEEPPRGPAPDGTTSLATLVIYTGLGREHAALTAGVLAGLGLLDRVDGGGPAPAVTIPRRVLDRAWEVSG